MLLKKVKNVNSLHNEYFYLERKINTEIGKLEKRAKSDFKKLMRRSNLKAKVKFSSLREDAYTKDWKPQMFVRSIWGFDTDKQLKSFCLTASEKIGIEFIPVL